MARIREKDSEKSGLLEDHSYSLARRQLGCESSLVEMRFNERRLAVLKGSCLNEDTSQPEHQGSSCIAKVKNASSCGFCEQKKMSSRLASEQGFSPENFQNTREPRDRSNGQIQLFSGSKIRVMSAIKDDQAKAIDTLIQDWNKYTLAYVFPPQVMIELILNKIYQYNKTSNFIMIYPWHPKATWFSKILALATQPPLRLPVSHKTVYSI